MHLDALASMPLDEIEDIYCRGEVEAAPTGLYRGRLLTWLDTPAARHPLWRPVLAAMFQLGPFGVDFDRRTWFFLDPRARTGRFQMDAGRSRFRPTETLRLTYHGSALPGPLRDLLYDEVKPLAADLCLGLGGLTLAGRPTPVFYFGLERPT